MAARSTYTGSRRKLVLAFDLGTTFSGISYSILDPGQAPLIKGVTKFPAQETISGASKIPTVIYYDRKGNVQAVGAETQADEVYEKAETNGWVKAEWFKLHLRSKYGAGKDVAERIPPLPLNKTVVEVISDFLRYLQKCARTYIQENHANGIELWKSVEEDIDYVLSHPNGWEGREQSQMRCAAVLSDLIPDTPEGHRRVVFVTEGEASLHFAVQNLGSTGALQHSNGIVIVDAGGGTVDISTYQKKEGAGDALSYEEIAAAQCHFHGSLFVTIHAHLFLSNYLQNSPFFDDVDHLVQCFDKLTKHRFRTDRDPQYIKFGTTRDNDPEHEIRFGQLKLNGSDVAQFFEPSIVCIVDAVSKIKETCERPISDVILVGGFAANDWLYGNVQVRLSQIGLNIVRPDNHVNKAVSDGAISFYIDHFVRTRVARMSYGVMFRPTYNPSVPQHVKLEHLTGPSVSGVKRLPYQFRVLVAKGTQVTETKEFRLPGFGQSTVVKGVRTTLVQIACYRGDLEGQLLWKCDDPDNFAILCRIKPALSQAPYKTLTNTSGGTYYRVDCTVILSFGLTEMKAQVAWLDNDGVEHRSPAEIMYDPDDSRDVQ